MIFHVSIPADDPERVAGVIAELWRGTYHPFIAPNTLKYSQVHINMQTALIYAEVLALARREGWTARICDRGGLFELVEYWLEDKFMLELNQIVKTEMNRLANNKSLQRACPRA